MRSGTKNAYCQIYRLVESTDAATNAAIYTPTLRMNAWANATPRRGREVNVDGQIVAESYVKFDFDFYDVVGMTELDYIEHEGVKYDIKGILRDIGTKQWVTVDAVSQPAGTERT